MLADRVAKLETIVLLRGAHSSQDEGMCALEAVAWIAGEEHSDHPKCACPILSAFMRRWNDDLDEAGRQRLKPLIPRPVGTRYITEVEQRRGWMAADWLVRVHTPARLRLAKLDEQAAALEGLPELVDLGTLTGVRGTINAARDRAAAARYAALDAAGDAAGDVARAAARAAAGDAALDAALAAARAAALDAALAAAGDAALDAAGDAARDAARDAATKRLEPTKRSLQDSALDLLGRMIECR